MLFTVLTVTFRSFMDSGLSKGAPFPHIHQPIQAYGTELIAARLHLSKNAICQDQGERLFHLLSPRRNSLGNSVQETFPFPSLRRQVKTWFVHLVWSMACFEGWDALMDRWLCIFLFIAMLFEIFVILLLGMGLFLMRYF